MRHVASPWSRAVVVAVTAAVVVVAAATVLAMVAVVAEAVEAVAVAVHYQPPKCPRFQRRPLIL